MSHGANQESVVLRSGHGALNESMGQEGTRGTCPRSCVKVERSSRVCGASRCPVSQDAGGKQLLLVTGFYYRLLLIITILRVVITMKSQLLLLLQLYYYCCYYKLFSLIHCRYLL